MIKLWIETDKTTVKEGIFLIMLKNETQITTNAAKEINGRTSLST